MALFPYLELEKKIQVNDRTRMEGIKSFVSNDEAALTVMTVAPGGDESPIDVFDADADLRYLEWQFADFEGDFDTSNNKLDFSENGGAELTATVSTATYSLSALVTEVQTQLNATGTLVYTVAIDDDEKITISVPGDDKFSLFPKSGTNRDVSAWPILGFKPLGRKGNDDSIFDQVNDLEGKVVEWLPKRITLSVDNASTPAPVTETVMLYSVSGDHLFSSDPDLVTVRSDILKYVRAGRNSFKDYHRQSQEDILAFLDEEGHVDLNGEKFTKHSIVDIEEVNNWSVYLTLSYIFRDIIKSNDDEFFVALRGEFFSKSERYKKRMLLRLDVDGDGSAELGEGLQIRSGRLVRL